MQLEGDSEGEEDGVNIITGSHQQENQASIAAAMGNVTSIIGHGPDYVIALGDNFYDKGVYSSTDVLWSTYFKQMYLTNYTALNVSWYAVLGNHDYGYGYTGIAAQLEGPSTDDNNWHLPANDYIKTFPLPDGGYIAIVFIDTVTLAPSECDSCSYQNASDGKALAEQYSKIEGMLSSVTTSDNAATWLLMVGHYPIFSAGSHGDSEEMVSTIQPLITKYGVHAYFCGHDHISEHLMHEGSHYFVAGAGSKTDALGSDGSEADLLWAGTGYSAYGIGIATNDVFTVTYVNTYSQVVYNYTLTNPTTSVARNPTVQPTVAPSLASPKRPLEKITPKVEDNAKPVFEVVMLVGIAFFASFLLLPFQACNLMYKKWKEDRISNGDTVDTRSAITYIDYHPTELEGGAGNSDMYTSYDPYGMDGDMDGDQLPYGFQEEPVLETLTEPSTVTPSRPPKPLLPRDVLPEQVELADPHTIESG
jgi:tartrate-resistant acid phosphatase type 5